GRPGSDGSASRIVSLKSRSHGNRTAPGCGRGSRGPRRESENRTGHHRREPPGPTDRRSEGADEHECIAPRAAGTVTLKPQLGIGSAGSLLWSKSRSWGRGKRRRATNSCTAGLNPSADL